MNKAANSRGFTLVEGLIVLAVVAVIAAMTASFMASQATDTLHDAMIAAEAKDMALLSRAADDYTKAHDDQFPVGTTKTIAVTDLISEHLLPDAFANRNGAVGTSPFYQAYTIVAQRVVAGEPVRIVVSDGPDSNSPAPPVGRLSRIGVPYTTQAIRALKQAIAEKIQREYRVVAATLPPTGSGWASVDGVAGAFTKELTGLLHALSWPRAVTLVNFPDLSLGGGDGGGDDGGGGGLGDYKSCRLAKPIGHVTGQYRDPDDGHWIYTGTITQATCPAGYQSVAQWPYCPQESGSPDRIWSTPAGSITYGYDTVHTYVGFQVVDPHVSCNYPQDSGCTPAGKQVTYKTFDTYKRTGTVLINGARVADDGVCYETVALQGRTNDAYGNGCRTGAGGAYPCAVQGYQINDVTRLGGANDKLCCLPK